MKAPALGFEHIPPLSAPLRFFLTAPAFGLAAGLVLLWHGPEALASRWTPPLLSITHLITIGFLAMVMIGALFQLLPVVAGAAVDSPLLTASVVHAALLAGTIALAVGFLAALPLMLLVAAGLLLLGFILAIAKFAASLRRSAVSHPFVSLAPLSLVSLTVTVALGAWLAIALASGLAVPFAALTDLHLQWGLGGWVALLVAAVAAQVVPMFQATPPYSTAAVRWLGRAALLALVLVAVAPLAGVPPLIPAAKAGFSMVAAIFAVYTLRLLRRRRRTQPDVTTTLWRFGMTCAIAALLSWSAAQFAPALGATSGYPLALGVLSVGGFATSVVTGMLYKIVPFLLWLHLQQAVPPGHRVPHVKHVLPLAPQSAQSALHRIAVLALAAAAVWPAALTRVAALAVLLSFALLWINLLRSAWFYLRVQAGSPQARATPPERVSRAPQQPRSR